MTDKDYRLALTQAAFQIASLDLPPDPRISYNAELSVGEISVMIVVTAGNVKERPPVNLGVLDSPTAPRRLGPDRPTNWPLTEKDRKVIEIIRLEPGLLTKEIAKRLRVSPRNTDLRARLANLAGRHILTSSASRGYTLGPFAPPIVDDVSPSCTEGRPDLRSGVASLGDSAAMVS